MSTRKIFKSREELDKYKEKNPLLSIEYIVTKESGDVVVSFIKSSALATSELKKFNATYDVLWTEESPVDPHSFTVEAKDKSAALQSAKIETSILEKAHKVHIRNIRIKETGTTLESLVSQNGKEILRLYERLLSQDE